MRLARQRAGRPEIAAVIIDRRIELPGVVVAEMMAGPMRKVGAGIRPFQAGP
jgi:hypothetical protein